MSLTIQEEKELQKQTKTKRINQPHIYKPRFIDKKEHELFYVYVRGHRLHQTGKRLFGVLYCYECKEFYNESDLVKNK